MIDVACSRFNLNNVKARKRLVTATSIQYELSKIVKIDAEQIAQKETLNPKKFRKNPKGVVYGQDEAIENIVDKILVAQAGLKSDDKPNRKFCIYGGPTGTGKTETAKQLASALSVELVRFDMSEYQEKHSVAKLIRSSWHVGHEDTSGILIEKLQEHPNCVLLLDEVRKP